MLPPVERDEYMYREIEPGVIWIQELGPDRTGMFVGEDPPAWYREGSPVRIPQCAYLLAGDETLLFDTLSPAATEGLLDDLEAILDGDPLDYLVVSHPDVPHAGNTWRVLEAYPDCTLVAPRYGEGHPLYHLDEARLVGEGDSIDLGGRVVGFHEATFLDAPVSMWMTERTTNALFPVDWFGYPHHDTERLSFVDEIEGDATVDRLVAFHGRVMFWYQYVDAEKVKREIDRLIAAYDPALLAPAHGLVVRENASEYMERMKPVVDIVSEEGRVGTLG